jgi:hypothetical protein
MKKLISVAAVAFAVVLSGCGSTGGDAVQSIAGPTAASKIKFFNFGVCGATSTATTSCMPSVNFYANDTKVTAASTTSCVNVPAADTATTRLCNTTGLESTTGTAYGGVGSGGGCTSSAGCYNGLNAGAYTFSGRISAATDKDLPVASLATTIETGKSYSFYLSGLYNTTTKKTESFVVEDALPAARDDAASVRFVNAIYNSSPMILYAKSTVTGVETQIGNAVSYKTGGAFVAVPGASYDLSVRVAGSSTNLITRAGVSFSAGHIYTIGARGDMTVTGSTPINRPFLDNTANY